MQSTPLATKSLNAAIFMHAWDQTALAKASGLHNSVVSLHLGGKRPIRDDHLAAYCAVLDRHEQSTLVAAWLHDTLPAEAHESVLSENNRLKEEVRAWRPGLDAEQQQMLDWWSHKLAADDELDDIFRAITKKAGWQAPP